MKNINFLISFPLLQLLVFFRISTISLSTAENYHVTSKFDINKTLSPTTISNEPQLRHLEEFSYLKKQLDISPIYQYYYYFPYTKDYTSENVIPELRALESTCFGGDFTWISTSICTWSATNLTSGNCSEFGQQDIFPKKYSRPSTVFTYADDCSVSANYIFDDQCEFEPIKIPCTNESAQAISTKDVHIIYSDGTYIFEPESNSNTGTIIIIVVVVIVVIVAIICGYFWYTKKKSK